MNETDYAEEAYECLKRLMKSVNSAEEWPELFEKIFEAISSYIEM